MRYLFGLMSICAMVALPLSVGAQGDQATEQEPAWRASSTSSFGLTPPEEAASERRLAYAGGALMVRGPASMIATRSLLGVRKGKLRRSEEGEHGSNLEWVEWSGLQSLQWLLQGQPRIDPEPATRLPPLSEGSWLRLELDFAGVRVVPMPPSKLELVPPPKLELDSAGMEVRVRRAKIGIGVSTVPILVGGIIAISSEFVGGFDFWVEPRTPEEEVTRRRVLGIGIAFMGVGAASMIATGILLGVRKRKLRRFQEVADLGHRRVQWDLAQSRLVF